MNEQQIQQILTIQQAIAAAATAAVINSLLNPQQAAAGLANNNPAALTEALQNSQNQLDLQQHQQQQHQHQPDSRQDSPIATSSSPLSSNQPSLNDAARLQELLLQLQQQAAVGANSANSTTIQQQQQQQQAALAAALNLNLSGNNINNLPIQQQLQSHLTGSPLSQSPIGNRLQLGQNDLNSSASPATNSNISNQSSLNKRLKNRQQQQQSQQPTVPPFNTHSRTSLDAPARSSAQQSTPKNHHSNIANLNTRNSSNTSSSSTFLPNNVGLPRKLVRGQDVWLGRGAEQTRQILKCMWCGQSFRTLAEMTQHMRETQHYTNIISQEQITSWRQPDGSESSSSKQNPNKQSNNNSSRLQEDLNDDFSDPFNDSDDSFSNEDEPPSKQRSAKGRSHQKTSPIKRDSFSIEISNSGSNSAPSQSTPNIKPSTRSRKRENEDASKSPTKKEKIESNQSPELDIPAQQPRVLSDLNEDSEANKDTKTEAEDQDVSSIPQQISATNSDEERSNSPTPSGATETNKQEDNLEASPKSQQASSGKLAETDNQTDDENSQRDNEDETKSELDNGDQDEDDIKSLMQADDEENKGDSKVKRRAVKRIQSDANAASGAKPLLLEGQRVDASGDPLSALETMVEKSFDPRLRPGLASGGILQRLGIDEEVCPPWQHINYANWYAAAAYGHPMAAALLAAGINLQNGIKLGKNLSSKKADDD